MGAYKVGMWMYQNGGGEAIQTRFVKQLQERGIDVVCDLNLKCAIAKNGSIVCNDTIMENLDLFFSYNAGQQTQYQVYLYKILDDCIPIINNFKAFALTEDKFQTSHLLRRHGIKTPDFKLCSKDNHQKLRTIFHEWGGKMVYKPTDGWGGVGIVKIENEQGLDMLMPFLNQMPTKHFYVEKLIRYDYTDYRIDIVDGEFIACYGRKAAKNNWKTNVTSGGSIMPREPNEKIISLAKKAATITGLEIAGVDLIYDQEKEEYVVLEVNGIPAFATPEQEKIGLTFNNKKIDAIVQLMEKRLKQKESA